MTTQLIYASRPFGFDAAMLIAILFQARAFNSAHDVTGALICRDDIYLQLLEGPDAVVNSLYERIARDDRHTDIVELARRSVTTRMFPQWAMREDPFQSWMWSRDQIAAGAIADVSPQEALAVFTRLAAKPRLVGGSA